MQSVVAHQHLLESFPEIRQLLTTVGCVELPEKDRMATDEAVVSITIGQMLSRKAASTIYSRLVKRRKELGLNATWELEVNELLSLGVSRRKARTIHEFALLHCGDSRMIRRWPTLAYEDLAKEVKANIWGFSDWSAAMLAIFHFGNPDVFPTKDGTIQRVSEILIETHFGGRHFDPELARPYSSYLALAMWKFADENLL